MPFGYVGCGDPLSTHRLVIFTSRPVLSRQSQVVHDLGLPPLGRQMEACPGTLPDLSSESRFQELDSGYCLKSKHRRSRVDPGILEG